MTVYEFDLLRDLSRSIRTMPSGPNISPETAVRLRRVALAAEPFMGELRARELANNYVQALILDDAEDPVETAATMIRWRQVAIRLGGIPPIPTGIDVDACAKRMADAWSETGRNGAKR